ncbi:MAG: hypothetical protein ACLQGT_01265 [Terracidiphilus sp.]
MPEPGPEIVRTRRAGELNEPQQRRLLVTCKYIDGLLSDIEQALHSTASESPFPSYIVDVTRAQAIQIEGHIRSFRAQLLQTLEWQSMKPEPPEIPVTRSIMTDLSFIDNAIEELKPKYLRGCGAVPTDSVDGLNRVIHELRSHVKNMESYLRHEMSVNPEAKDKP